MEATDGTYALSERQIDCLLLRDVVFADMLDSARRTWARLKRTSFFGDLLDPVGDMRSLTSFQCYEQGYPIAVGDLMAHIVTRYEASGDPLRTTVQCTDDPDGEMCCIVEGKAVYQSEGRLAVAGWRLFSSYFPEAERLFSNARLVQWHVRPCNDPPPHGSAELDLRHSVVRGRTVQRDSGAVVVVEWILRLASSPRLRLRQAPSDMYLFFIPSYAVTSEGRAVATPPEEPVDPHLLRVAELAEDPRVAQFASAPAPQQDLIEGASGEAKQATRRCVFRRNGDVWEIAFTSAKRFLVDDLKGMRYLSYLLAQPNAFFSATELVALVEKHGPGQPVGVLEDDDPDDEELPSYHIKDVGENQPQLDETSIQQYQQALEDLAEERLKAEASGDIDRLDEVDEEFHQIKRVLTSALGLGGKPRMFSDGASNARSSVSKAIKYARDRLEEYDPLLADHLKDTVKAGYELAYIPERGSPIVWEM